MRPPDAEAGFRAALAGGPITAGLLAAPEDEIAPRIAVYRNNIAHGLRQALSRRFPVVERLVGAEFFAAMAAPFIAAHPPRSPVLQEWGDAFPGFLAGFPPLAGLPYLPDVARIEWARGLAFHAADATALPPGSCRPTGRCGCTPRCNCCGWRIRRSASGGQTSRTRTAPASRTAPRSP